jgi:hypothetical protein
VFFLDDNAFMEGGILTRAESVANPIVDTHRPDGQPDSALPTMTVRARAVPTMATFSVGAWSEQVELTARASATVTLPARGEAPNWRVKVETGPGFRPAEHEPGSHDGRHLGVWLEFR